MTETPEEAIAVMRQASEVVSSVLPSALAELVYDELLGNIDAVLRGSTPQLQWMAREVLALADAGGIRLSSVELTPEQGTFYIRWKAGEPREGRVLNPLAADDPATGLLCLVCHQPLGDGRSVQLYAVGPDDEETAERHAQGRWYSAQAALLHAECVPRVLVDEVLHRLDIRVQEGQEHA